MGSKDEFEKIKELYRQANILLGNLMTPWFNAWGHQTPLGYKKPQKAAKGGKE